MKSTFYSLLVLILTTIGFKALADRFDGNVKKSINTAGTTERGASNGVIGGERH